MAGIDYSKEGSVGCESPAPTNNSEKGCGVKGCYLCNSWGNHSSVVSEQSYKDSLAAKNDIAREEIVEDGRPFGKYQGIVDELERIKADRPNFVAVMEKSIRDKEAQKVVDADFAQRNAELKEYIAGIKQETKEEVAAIAARREVLRKALLRPPTCWYQSGLDNSNSDGFYGVVPKTNAGLLAVLEIYKRLVRDLTDVVINQAGK